jgi:Family of unknown function (DUF6200)
LLLYKRAEVGAEFYPAAAAMEGVFTAQSSIPSAARDTDSEIQSLEGIMSTLPPTGAGQPEPPRPGSSGRPPLVVVDLGKRQSPKNIKRLRKGRGKLVPRVEHIIDELIQAGTVKADTQAVVIVVRERISANWPFHAI